MKIKENKNKKNIKKEKKMRKRKKKMKDKEEENGEEESLELFNPLDDCVARMNASTPHKYDA